MTPVDGVGITENATKAPDGVHHYQKR